MSHDQLILSVFFFLVFVTIVLVARKGIGSRLHLCGGVCALVSLSVIAIVAHCFVSLNGDTFEFHRAHVSLGDMGMGVAFLGLASIGLLCASTNE